MKQLSIKQLKELWFQFWKNKNHQVLSSCSLVSKDDSLLWINSGVAGLKSYFLGLESPPCPKMVNIQKVVRTNDLDKIGQTNRHLSFFEMMGNFSIGAYFKRDAIIWAWEFLTDSQWLNLDKNKLYITVFKDDQIAIEVCQKDLKINDDHLFLGEKETNFWDLGVGPCGPNLEFFYDLGAKFDPDQKGTTLLKKNIENDRYLEIWNIVFSEFLNLGKNNYQSLPKKNIDTGAGLERLLTILQGKNNFFETDLFTDVIQFLTKKTKTPFYFQLDHLLSKDKAATNQKMKIITDHIRTITFLLADWFATKKELDLQNQQGYVIKKMIRNASLQGYLLQIKKPFLFTMVPLIVKQMVVFYPLLSHYQQKIEEILQREEKKFLTLLQHPKLQSILSLSPLSTVAPETIFQLVTEIGLPILFLKHIAQAKKLNLSLRGGYEQLLVQHQMQSKTKKNQFVDQLKILIISSSQSTQFLEHQHIVEQVKVLGIFIDGQSVQEVLNQKCWLIFDKTPFYAEKGGQISDQGSVINSMIQGQVLDVQLNKNRQYLHLVEVQGFLKINDYVTLAIDQMKRQLTAKNHSATHLLHATLRNVIGENVQQNGSLNNENYLRLDFFSDQANISFNQLQLIQTKVNWLIKKAIKPQIIWTSHSQAEKLQALDFFDIKKYYPDKVKVVKFGDYSIELCGGTHAQNTDQIENFLLTKFSKIGQNNYRLYAWTTQKKVHDFLETKEKIFQDFLLANTKDVQYFLNQSQGKKLMQQIEQNSDFYLTKDFYQIKFKNMLKIFQNQMKGQRLEQFVNQYQIPNSNFHLINEINFVYHQIQFPNSVNLNPILVLRQIFDKYKGKEESILFLFIHQGNDNWNFLLEFNLKNIFFDWKTYIHFIFTDKIKFGVKKNKFQGVLVDFCPSTFLVTLKQKIKNLTDSKPKNN